MQIIKQLLLVGTGGFLGSALRFLISKLNESRPLFSLPTGTLLVNVIGSLFIGFLAGWLVNQSSSGNLRLLLMVGFCGGFTTFSAFSIENLKLIEQGAFLTALSYIFISIGLGIAVVWLGYFFAKSL